MNKNKLFKDKTVLVTRPEELAGSLLQRIRDAGGTAQHYPVLRISPVEESEALNTIINNLPNFDIAIFISPTAAQKTFEKIKTLPEHLVLAVIGRSTETMLNKHGFKVQIVPDDFNSESLLLHPDLQAYKIRNKSILIFRGVGGRDLLGHSLTQRGATVSYAEIYRREKNPLDSLTQQQLEHIDVITVTSNEGLQNLYDLTNDQAKSALTLLPVIVPGDRAYDLASQLGFKTIIKSSNATDDACMQTLTELFTD
jgi:uroporphyrinogen-III synthase